MNLAAADVESLHLGRRRAADSLNIALNQGLSSERRLAERWVDIMRERGVGAFWYVPPENGTAVLSGSGGHARLALPSFRPEAASPSQLAVTAEPVTVYTSPVSNTGLIEDFGITLYRGGDAKVRSHLQKVADLVADLSYWVTPGMRYCDVYRQARKRWEAAGLANDISSSTDVSGTNIGHSIPFFGQQRDFTARTPGSADLISRARQFVSATNNSVIDDTCAFTVEPRLGSPSTPVVWFHVVVAFVNGQRHVITEFTPVLEIPGLEWFTNPWQ